MRYVIAVRRDKRREVPSNWIYLLGNIEGMQVFPHASNARVEVEANETAVALAKERLGDFVHVEPVIVHRLSR